MPSQQPRIDWGMTFLGGFIATVAMSVFLYVTLPTLSQAPAQNAYEFFSDRSTLGWVAGILVHLLLGAVVFPLVFLGFLFHRLPGAPWLRGLQWGLILWVLAEVIAMPIAGKGVFHTADGGPGAVVAFLFAHALYGIMLGRIARRTDPVEAGEPSSIPPGSRAAE